MAIQNDKQFGTKLAGFKTSSLNQRANLQELIEYGLAKYAEHTDTSALGNVMNVLMNVRTIPSRTIKEYIKDHANIKLIKDAKSGLYKWKKEGEAAQVKPIVAPWYEHESNKKNDATVDGADPVAMLALVYKRLTEALEGNKVPQSRIGLAQDGLGRIRDLLKDVRPLSKDELKAEMAAMQA